MIGPQVEHATAHVVYSRMVDQIIGSTTISKTRNALREAFSHLPISLSDLEEMDNAERRISIFKAERENIKQLRGRTDLLFNPDIVNEGMVEGIKAMNAKTAAIIIDCAVFAANKMPYANFPTEGVPANPNTGSERIAKNRLALLSDVLETVVEMRDSQKAIHQRLVEQLHRMQDNLQKHWGITRYQIDELLQNNTITDDLFYSEEIQRKIAYYISQLFYFPRLQTTHHYTINGIEGDWAVSKEDWCEVMKIDPETEQKISGKPRYNHGTLPRNNDPEIMYDVAGRHLVAIFHAFRGLSRFCEENQESIVESFLEKSVLKDSMDGDESMEGFTSSIVRQKIRDVTILAHDKRIYAAKGSIFNRV